MSLKAFSPSTIVHCNCHMVIRSVEYAGTCSLSKCYAAYKGFYSLKRLIAVLWTPSPSPKSVRTARPVLTERAEKGFGNSPGRTKANLDEKSYWVSKLKRNSQANMLSLLKETSHKKHIFSRNMMMISCSLFHALENQMIQPMVRKALR